MQDRNVTPGGEGRATAQETTDQRRAWSTPVVTAFPVDKAEAGAHILRMLRLHSS